MAGVLPVFGSWKFSLSFSTGTIEDINGKDMMI